MCRGKETLLKGTDFIKMRLRFLAGGMYEWHVRSNKQQRQLFRNVLLFMPCIARRYLWLKRQHCYKALIFGYFLIK